jgi:hypothetical protein
VAGEQLRLVNDQRQQEQQLDAALTFVAENCRFCEKQFETDETKWF